jgi:hypothetical protein
MDQKPNQTKLTLDRFDVVALLLLGVWTVAFGCGWAMGINWFSSGWLLVAGAFVAAAAFRAKRFFQKREKSQLFMAVLLLLTAGFGVLLAYDVKQNKQRIRLDQQKEQEMAETSRRERIESAVQAIRRQGGGFGPYLMSFVELKTDSTPFVEWRGRETVALYSFGGEGMQKGVYLFDAKEYSFVGNENRIKANSPGKKPLYISWPQPLQFLKVSQAEPENISEYTSIDLKPFEPSNQSLRILAAELGNQIRRYMKQMVTSTPAYAGSIWSSSEGLKISQDYYEQLERSYTANGKIDYFRTTHYPKGSPRDFLMAHVAKEAVGLEICKRGLEGEIKSPNPTAAAVAKQLIDQIDRYEKNPYAWESH